MLLAGMQEGRDDGDVWLRPRYQVTLSHLCLRVFLFLSIRIIEH
jgi:hypothetical protein